jgi:hypothetical protein
MKNDFKKIKNLKNDQIGYYAIMSALEDARYWAKDYSGWEDCLEYIFSQTKDTMKTIKEIKEN